MVIELPGTIAENIGEFAGRGWVLPRLLSWLEHSNDRILLLSGGPGTGKSMLAAWLAGAGPAPTDAAASSQLEKIRSKVGAAHFCMAASRNTSPRSVAENITGQLTQNINQFGAALTATLTERVQITVSQQINQVAGGNVTGVSIGRLDLGALDDEASFDNAFIRPVKKLFAAGYAQPVILIFDALDEAQTYSGHTNLVQLLAGLDDLPAGVRFIATTRPDPRVLKLFQGCPVIDLITDMPDDAGDVTIYVSQRLAARAPSLEGAARDLVAARIGDVAKGVFLYAHMVVEDLLLHLSNIRDLENYPLPEGLCRLYHSFLNRELGRNEADWYRTFRPLLGLIAVSQGGGLTRTQLAAMIGQEIDLPLRACKQYLAGDLPNGPFRIFDRSFSDFLLKSEDNPDYHINLQEMHLRIANYYMENFQQKWQQCDSYGLNYTVDHMLAAGINAQERKATIDRILTDDFVNAIQERMGWLYAFIEDLEALAKVEPAWAAKQCNALILDRPPNSLVIQHALRLLVRLRPETGASVLPATAREGRLDKIVQILCDQAGNVTRQLIECLDSESNDRVRGSIALALAETKDPEATTCLMGMVKNEYGEASWAAADALVALNNRSIISDLIQWYLELKVKRDRRSVAQKNRIIYVLGWMHAEEAQQLKPLALAASDARIIGRAIDLTFLLKPQAGDTDYLHGQMQRILASSPEHPEELGAWADEWLQKRLVRAIQRLHVSEALPDLRRLQEHIRRRLSVKPPSNQADMTDLAALKRQRLVEAVEDAITEMQIGR
jgi:hypothetical protein